MEIGAPPAAGDHVMGLGRRTAPASVHLTCRMDRQYDRKRSGATMRTGFANGRRSIGFIRTSSRTQDPVRRLWTVPRR